MVTTERPCCESPLLVELPLPPILHCNDCSVSWTVTDPAAESVAVALAA
jgi:hypothetical protein